MKECAKKKDIPVSQMIREAVRKYISTCKEYCKNLLDIRIPQNTELKLTIDKDKIFECIQKAGSKYKKIIIKY